jgi:hypothetical protein
MCIKARCLCNWAGAAISFAAWPFALLTNHSNGKNGFLAYSSDGVFVSPAAPFPLANKILVM